MGSTVLVVGRMAGRKERRAAAAYLAGASDAELTSDTRAALLKAWDAAPAKIACLDALNEASTCAFGEHAAALEGLKDFNEAMTRGRWRHLPYWIDSYWLPVRSDTTFIERDNHGWPSFFGSAYGLLANLADIAAASPYCLGTVPPHFELMRTNLRAFYAGKLDAFDEPTTLQWVWRGPFAAGTLFVWRDFPRSTGYTSPRRGGFLPDFARKFLLSHSSSCISPP